MISIFRSDKRRETAYRPSTDLVPEVLDGNRASIARMITRAEAGYAEAGPALAQLYKHSGKAHIVGITGVPGAGKSTLVSTLIKAFTADGYKVGVIAVDPSSPYSGGAILGDRVRMSDSAEANQAYVRSMATRGNLGGLARSTLEAVDILDAAGYSPIIIETVGVGQDEVEVVSAAHTVVVLSAPGLGDDIQAIKAGILEIADIHSVSKSDKPEAAATVSALKGMMALGTVRTDTSWPAPIVPVSSVSGDGIAGLKDTILAHWAHLNDSGEIEGRRRNMCKTRILGTAKHLFYQKFEEDAAGLAGQLQAVMDRRDDPSRAAHALLGWDHEGSDT